jgi:intracellular septation protein A
MTGETSGAPIPLLPGEPGPAGTTQPGPPPARPGRQLALLAFDIGAPIAVYYILHRAGVSNLMALSASAVLPALAAAVKLAVTRRVDTVAIVVLATIVVSIGLSVAVHSPRFLLARDGLITAVWGTWFAATLGARRPAAFSLARPFMEGRKVFGTRSWDWLWETDARFRRIWRTATVLWAAAMLTDAVIRVVVSYSLPIDVVPAVGGALWPVTFVVIQVITNVYYHRAGLYRILGARWATRTRT